MRPGPSARRRGEQPFWLSMLVLLLVGVGVAALKWLGLASTLENNAEAIANSTAFEAVGIVLVLIVLVLALVVYPVYLRLE